MPTYSLGKDAKLYVGDTLLSSVVAVGDVTWTEEDEVRDVTLNLDRSEADVTTRANSGWRATATTLADASVDFMLIFKSDDSQFESIRDAFTDNTEIALAIMDGDITSDGTQGLAANFVVTSFSRSEPLEEGISYDVTVRPSTRHEWYEASAS